MKGHSLGYASRTEVVKAEWHNIPFGRRRYLELTLDEKGTRVFGVHLSAIHSNITERRRMYETTSLLSGIARHQTGFHVITGDFNTLAPGERLGTSVRYRCACARSCGSPGETFAGGQSS